ncbi:MAG: hypothetical protein OQJ97_08400 [Rhodospirillales bacterium]|nr:hypothetical protein [Rhodospirillales bacterium]
MGIAYGGTGYKVKSRRRRTDNTAHRRDIQIISITEGDGLARCADCKIVNVVRCDIQGGRCCRIGHREVGGGYRLRIGECTACCQIKCACRGTNNTGNRIDIEGVCITEANRLIRRANSQIGDIGRRVSDIHRSARRDRQIGGDETATGSQIGINRRTGNDSKRCRRRSHIRCNVDRTGVSVADNHGACCNTAKLGVGDFQRVGGYIRRTAKINRITRRVGRNGYRLACGRDVGIDGDIVSGIGVAGPGAADCTADGQHIAVATCR